jgi:hypothetical protein
MCGNVVSDFTDDVLGFDPNGGGVFSVARDVLGDKIADDVLGMDPNGGGFIPVYNTAANIAVSALAGDALGGLANMAGAPLELTDATSMSDLGYSGVAPDVITEVPMPDFTLPSDLPLELTDTTSMADLGYSGVAPDVITEVPAPDFNVPSNLPTDLPIGDQPGDYPTQGNYGTPTAPGVQEAVQNLLDTNTLQELTGAPLDVLGDQPGDYPTQGSYGDPLAPGVKEAAQNLLDYNAANAAGALSSYTPSPSTVANALKAVLGGGATAGGLTNLGATSGAGIGGDTSGIKNLTPGLTHASTDFELAGEPVVRAASGGGVGSYFNSGLSSSDSSAYNYLDDTYSKLKPGLLKPNINFSLSGMPQGHADGGSIEGHNPQFYSEGGLQHRYVKGEGDGTSDSVPAMLASGEFVIPADVVSGLGNGDNDAGAEVLDEFLSVIRSHKRAADSKDLPEDSKGPLTYLAEAKKKVRA